MPNIMYVLFINNEFWLRGRLDVCKIDVLKLKISWSLPYALEFLSLISYFGKWNKLQKYKNKIALK